MTVYAMVIDYYCYSLSSNNDNDSTSVIYDCNGKKLKGYLNANCNGKPAETVALDFYLGRCGLVTLNGNNYSDVLSKYDNGSKFQPIWKVSKGSENIKVSQDGLVKQSFTLTIDSPMKMHKK